MAQQVKALYRCRKEYFKRYQTLQKYGYNILDEQRLKRIKEVFATFRFCNFEDSDSVVHVLAIGTSNGVSDIPIIDVLINRFQRIDYTVVEPDEVEISRFKELVASYHEKGKWNAVDFKFNMMTIEQYLRRLEDDMTAETTKFDVVHAQHCAYHFQNPEIVFEKLYMLLNENGMLYNVINFGAWDDLSVKIQQMYSMSEMKSYSAATLREIMKSRLPEAYLRTILCRNIKINECFKEDSEEGNEMIDFLVQLLDFRKTAAEENVNKVEAFLKERCIHSGSDIVFRAEEEATVFVMV